jgi:AcrR family transcriptional regulator
MPAGRPRAFDTEKALDGALSVFWCKGYEGSSMPDLTKAMGVSSPSLYAAFGSKEGLFLKVLERYESGPSSYGAKALKAPTARAVAEQLLAGAVELHGNARNPRGCLVVQSALACSDAADTVRRQLIALRVAKEDAVCRRLKRAKAEGDLPADSDPAALARYLRTVIYGMAVQAASGASRKDLRLVADIALRAWPSKG